MSQGKAIIVDYLTSIPAWYLATVENTPEGGRPHVRPFSFAMLQDGEIQYCTATTKDVYREMQQNPFVELTAWKPGSGWVILRGRANLEDRANAQTRKEGFDHMVGLGEDWLDPNDDRLTFFTIDDAEAWICDIDGSWNPVEL
ncbi:pyridoxamine 5'-phosphate oxidase family protein [Adlercreutzia sp. R21]|uniref:pyridoxamine 5'-phosphate oxidase family protein n=1 Tax=Adlercreutzia wanghongyangiae TaxID=3111451 RepID=UPI002DB76B2E|nr:pyridoxamine 5'-phosphate oxidase family protein [Adlercreutzia sp. R21]MEC4185016.1 pyridoxamine 5'-phosphate oxidase family protein [Adlercreutzia sp. R21]